METTDQLISRLRHRGVYLSLCDENLRYTVRGGSLAPALLQELKERKDELKLFFRTEQIAGNTVEGRGDRPDFIPISILQAAYWGQPLLNGDPTLRVFGPLEVSALQSALTEVVRRHEVLRTVFVNSEEGVRQVIRDTEPFALEVIPDCSREDATGIIKAFKSQPFDLSRDTLLRAQLVVLESECLLTLTMPHLISDLDTVNIVLGEVKELYGSCVGARPSSLSEPLQFADYVLWERCHFAPLLIDMERYWDSVIAAPYAVRQAWTSPAADRAELDKLAAFAQGPKGKCHGTRISTDGKSRSPSFTTSADDLRRVASQFNATPLAVVMALFKTIVSAWTGQEDVCVSNVVSLRTNDELSSVIGFFVTVQHLRTRLEGSSTLGDLIKSVQRGSFHAMSLQQWFHLRQPRIRVYYIPFAPALAGDESALSWPRSERVLDEIKVNIEGQLLLTVAELEKEFYIQIMYHSDDFATGLIERVVAVLRNLVDSLDDIVHLPLADCVELSIRLYGDDVLSRM